MTNKVKITGLVLTHNSETTIEECLESLKWVDEIVLIDDESSDQTREIAYKYNSRVFIRKLDDFSSQRNFGLSNCSNDWVLVLDSDEVISKDLQVEIETLFNQPVTESGFQIPRKNMFMGSWIRSSYPDYGLRLFLRKEARYSGAVHECLTVNGEIGRLNHPIIHNSYRNIEEIIIKTNHYTTISAQQMYEKGKRAGFSDLLFRPLATFVKNYFLKGGIMDGLPGFLLHVLSGYYTFIKYAKLYFLDRNK